MARRQTGEEHPPEDKLYTYCSKNDVESASRYLRDLERVAPHEIRRRLLQCGGLFGYTPLHEASSAGHRDMVMALLQYDPYMEADNGYINIKTNNGYSALHLAAAGGHQRLVRQLIELGAEIEINNEFGMDPLNSCKISARHSTIKMMLSAAIIRAAQTDNVRMMKVLFEHSRLDVETGCLQVALTTAIDKDNPYIIAMVMDRGRGYKEVKMAAALKQAKSGQKHHARAILLMILAVREGDYKLALQLFGCPLPQYTHTWTDDEEFPLVQHAVANGLVPTEYAIVACEDQDSRVFEELLIRTEVYPQERVVLWSAFGLERINLSWLRHVNWVVSLQLNHNHIRKLPQDLRLFLRNAAHIHLDHNDLREVPHSLLELPSLKELSLAHNKLSFLPESNMWSAELQVLNLSHNKLQGLPPRIEAFRLKWLDLGCNQLSSGGGGLEVLGTLEKLEHLNLESNAGIEHLPKGLGRLQYLRELKLQGLTNLLDPPKSIVSEPTETVCQYLDAKLRSARPYYRMKLMLVGQAARGKTTLVKRLLKKSVKESDDESTAGIEVNEWLCKRGDQAVRFTLWDFGGQEVYYATHQCFLTQRSLYLLLWRMTDGERGVREMKPWLDNLAIRVPGCRVMIVGTHYDRLTAAELQDLETTIYPMINQLWKTYNGKKLQVTKFSMVSLHGDDYKKHLDTLTDAIYDQAVNQYLHPSRYPRNLKKGEDLLIQEKVPESYQALDVYMSHKRTAKGSPPVLHYSEYKDLVRKLGKADLYTDSEIRAASDYLHQIGSVLHFDDRKNHLDDLYFMDPHWLFNLMSSIVAVREKNPYVRYGVVERSSLPVIFVSFLQDQSSRAFLDQLIVLLDRFEIVLPLDKQRETLLIPSMLPTARPEGVGNPGPPGTPYLQRHIVFEEGLLPPGFWSRITARVMHSIVCVKEMIERRTAPSTSPANGRRRFNSSSSSSRCVVNDNDDASDDELDIDLGFPRKPMVSHGSPRRVSPPVNCGIRDDSCELKFWRTGLYYRQTGATERGEGLFFRVEAFEDARGSCGAGVCITTTADTQGVQLYGQITDICDKLLVEWYRADSTEIDHRLPCCRCLEELPGQVSYFKKQAIMDLLDGLSKNQHHPEQHRPEQHHPEQHQREGEVLIECENGHKLPIADVAPDILLGDIDHRFLLKFSDIHYSPEDILGKGGFGKVFRGHCGKQEVAIKLFAKGVAQDLAELRKETTILQSCHHPCLAGMVGVVIQPPHFYLVLELAPRGTIKRPFVQTSKPISRLVHFRIAAQIAAGLAFLHRSSYIFRDLKADNVLLWSLLPGRLVNCKLTDFGMASEVAPSGARNYGGTVGFMAPEVISAARPAYDQSVDTFSLGMVLYQMLARRNPYESIRKKGVHLVNSAISGGHTPELSDVNTATVGLPYLARLMRQCWAYAPEARPSMALLLPRLCSPLAQLTIGARTVYSRFSLRNACVRVFQEATAATVGGGGGGTAKPLTEVTDPIPGIELWLCLDSNKGTEVQVLSGETLKHLKTFAPIAHCQEKCMSLHGDRLWLATRDGLGESKIDVFDAASKAPVRTVWMRDCGPSCFCPHRDHMYIGTQEGCVFLLSPPEDSSSPSSSLLPHKQQQQQQSNNKQKCLCDHVIQGIAVVGGGRELWVSYCRTIAVHSLSLKPRPQKMVLPSSSSSSSEASCLFQVGELALRGNIVWGIHTGGVCVSGWDWQSRRCLFVCNVQSAIQAAYPDQYCQTRYSQVCCITAHCTALDTLWLGLITGQLLLLSTQGRPLLLLHPFDSHVRFLVSIVSPGPCRSEREMVLAGGKDFKQIDGLPLDPTDQDNSPHLLESKTDGNHKKSTSSPAETPPSPKDSNTVLLLEAVPAYLAKQMDLLQSGRAWDSYDELKRLEREVEAQRQHLQQDQEEEEEEPDCSSPDLHMEGLSLTGVVGGAPHGSVQQQQQQDRQKHLLYRKLSCSASSASAHTTDGAHCLTDSSTGSSKLSDDLGTPNNSPFNSLPIIINEVPGVPGSPVLGNHSPNRRVSPTPSLARLRANGILDRNVEEELDDYVIIH